MGPLPHEGRRLDYDRRPPISAPSAACPGRHVYERRVEAAELRPLFDYGRTGGTWSYKGDSYDLMTIVPQRGTCDLSWQV